MRLFLFLLMGGVAASQERLAEYLSLTNEQQQSLRAVQTTFDGFVSLETARAIRLESEIREERDRARPDAGAIGLRYVALEAMCREARQRHQSAMKQARALLSRAQLARLEALERALALLALAAEADKAMLIDAPGLGPLAIQLELMATRPLPGCQPPQPRERQGFPPAPAVPPLEAPPP
jgi:hypothetical protein